MSPRMWALEHWRRRRHYDPPGKPFRRTAVGIELRVRLRRIRNRKRRPFVGRVCDQFAAPRRNTKPAGLIRRPWRDDDSFIPF